MPEAIKKIKKQCKSIRYESKQPHKYRFHCITLNKSMVDDSDCLDKTVCSTYEPV